MGPVGPVDAMLTGDSVLSESALYTTQPSDIYGSFGKNEPNSWNSGICRILCEKNTTQAQTDFSLH